MACYQITSLGKPPSCPGYRIGCLLTRFEDSGKYHTFSSICSTSIRISFSQESLRNSFGVIISFGFSSQSKNQKSQNFRLINVLTLINGIRWFCFFQLVLNSIGGSFTIHSFGYHLWIPPAGMYEARIYLFSIFSQAIPIHSCNLELSPFQPDDLLISKILFFASRRPNKRIFSFSRRGDSRFPFFLSFHKKKPVCSLTAYLIRRNTKTEMSLLFNQMSSATVRVSLSSSKYVDHIFLPPISH